MNGFRVGVGAKNRTALFASSPKAIRVYAGQLAPKQVNDEDHPSGDPQQHEGTVSDADERACPARIGRVVDDSDFVPRPEAAQHHPRLGGGALAYVEAAVKAGAEHRRVLVQTIAPAAVKTAPART